MPALKPPGDADPFVRLRKIVAMLRAPGGCPWDREQTHSSLRKCLVEESYEVVEAIENGNDAQLAEELGDLLMNIFLHAQMAEERGTFTADDVAAGVAEKMIRRHPHVFGSNPLDTSAQVLSQWDAIKRGEKEEPSAGALTGICGALPALLRAQTVQKKAARVGFDWPDAGPVFKKLEEETDEILGAMRDGDHDAIEAEVGDLLFTAVNLARKLGVDAETALASTTRRFVRRFEAVEQVLSSDGKTMESTPLQELDAIWDRVKVAEAERAGARHVDP